MQEGSQFTDDAGRVCGLCGLVLCIQPTVMLSEELGNPVMNVDEPFTHSRGVIGP